MASSPRHHILTELRNGKRAWSYAPGGDYQGFRRQVVEPLRQLKYDGVIQALSEVESPGNGTTRVIAVHVIGEIDLSRTQDEDQERRR
ncbi:MAG TPA: hypothetical protein VM940_02685 [Chthoniobacterales bacterium]|nr:hypothetical protein [Chthoniobacterales bacterium]